MQRILIIDDDEQVRELLTEILEQAGYEVTQATNGAEGLKRYRACPTEMVITDLIMPEKEGMETIIALKKEFPDARIMVVSGGGRSPSVNYLPIAKTLGAKNALTKPFARQDILTAVRDTLTG